jgi:outer membrane biosynthesis protein TonB
MQQTTAKEAALNIFAILGFIALLIAGLWSTIQLMQLVFGFVGSSKLGKQALAPLASLSAPSVAIALADSNVAPNRAFAIGWSGKNVSPAGTLTFTYACREGLFLKVQASKDTQYAIPCNAPYAIPKDAASLSITPILATQNKIELPLTLTYTEAGSTTKDSTSITVDGTLRAPLTVLPIPPVAPAPVAPTAVVVPAAKPTPAAPVAAPTPKPVPPPAPKKTYTVEKPVQKSDVRGFVDLEARIVAIGKLAKNGTVSPRAEFRTNETVSITFEVVNNGTKAVSNWTYALILPTDPAYTYTSDAQPTLYAGSKATVTLSFDKLVAGTNKITLIADPAKLVQDATRTNNTAQMLVTVR